MEESIMQHQVSNLRVTMLGEALTLNEGVSDGSRGKNGSQRYVSIPSSGVVNIDGIDRPVRVNVIAWLGSANGSAAPAAKAK
jgi:hypothetical protein